MRQFQTIETLFDTLYKKGKGGKSLEYTIDIVEYTASSEILKKYGQVGGKIQEDRERFYFGKNIGRSNETTYSQQAMFEAESLYRKLLDDGYTHDINAEKTSSSGNIMPMLAHKYEDKRIKSWPVLVQPKLDGMRCLIMWVEGRIKLYSRKGKEFTALQHIADEISTLIPSDIVLDGELYIHDFPFQELSSAIKKKGEHTHRVMFRCYDMYATSRPKLSFLERNDMVRRLSVMAMASLSRYFAIVPTESALSKERIAELFSQWTSEGYEGAMIRIPSSTYEHGHRSYGLLKYKEFDDMEFPIQDVVEASGRDAGTAIFVLRNEDGNEFRARPQGTFEQRKAYFEKRGELIGEMLTVKYFGRSEDNIPRFPIGISVRDYE